MRHPLLLQNALEPLPELPSAASDDVDVSYLDSFGAPGADVLRQSSPEPAEGAEQPQVRNAFLQEQGLPSRAEPWPSCSCTYLCAPMGKF